MLITRSTLGLVGLFFAALLGIVLWQPATPTLAKETKSPVAPGSAGGSAEDKATESTEETASRGVPASNQPSPFPTLEAQRAADLAYKLLDIELEKISSAVLEHVKAKKFAGGLKVTAVDVSGGGGGEFGSDNHLPKLRAGDVLVGLHVWPTTSLADVKKVLERDDLQDLSPLKFYVIRAIPVHDDSGGHGEKLKIVVKLVTGRITVNIDAIKKKAVGNVIRPAAPPSPPKPHALAPGDSVKVIAVNVFPDQPIADVYRIEEMGTLSFGPTYGRIKVAGLTLLEAEAKVLGKLQSVLNDTLKEEVRVQITLEGKAFSK